LDVVWRELKERVLNEIRALVNEKEPTAAEIFQYRTTAARTVYDMLSEDEKAVIHEKIAKGGVDINPPDIQQR
jgi:uncharacterized protein YdhG (YjbR/CyaY superfamily)